MRVNLIIMGKLVEDPNSPYRQALREQARAEAQEKQEELELKRKLVDAVVRLADGVTEMNTYLARIANRVIQGDQDAIT